MMENLVRTEGRWLVSVGFLSDTGRARERNEDAYALFVPYAGERSTGLVDALLVVADGMGGHEDGDVASRLAADRLAAALTGVQADPYPGPDLPALLEGTLAEVNRELVALAAERGNVRGLGTTLTAAALRGSTLHLAHIGDSRCYRLRDGALAQLTEDHSWVAEQIRAGVLAPEEAEDHPQRNILTRCLGLDRDPGIFLAENEVRDRDRYLLCTDGLHGAVSDTVLARVLREEAPPQAAARRLVGLANEAGGADNITAIVADLSWQTPPETTLPGMAPAEAAAQGAAVAARHPIGVRALLVLGVLLLASALVGAFLLYHPQRGPAAKPDVHAGSDTSAAPATAQPGRPGPAGGASARGGNPPKAQE